MDLYLIVCIRILVQLNRFVSDEEGVNYLSTSVCKKAALLSLSDVLDEEQMLLLLDQIEKNSDILG